MPVTRSQTGTSDENMAPAPDQQEDKKEQPQATGMELMGTSSLAGSRYGLLNQDAVFTDVLHSDADLLRLAVPQCFMAVVLDGHGMLGELAARDAGRAMMRHLHLSDLRSCVLASTALPDVERLLTEAFQAGHEAALRHYDTAPATYLYPKGGEGEKRYTLRRPSNAGPPTYNHPSTGPRLLEFGSTAAAVLVQGHIAAVAHVGDSSVVLGRCCGEGYEGVELTRAHCGLDEAEVERMKWVGGGAVTFRSDGYVTTNPPGMSGAFSLAMSRALGHRMMASYGVIPTPTVTLLTLDPDSDVCLIAASDGLWEGLSASEAARAVGDALEEGRGAHSAAHALCKASVDLVRSKGKASRPDNTTAAVLLLPRTTHMDLDGPA